MPKIDASQQILTSFENVRGYSSIIRTRAHENIESFQLLLMGDFYSHSLKAVFVDFMYTVGAINLNISKIFIFIFLYQSFSVENDILFKNISEILSWAIILYS